MASTRPPSHYLPHSFGRSSERSVLLFLQKQGLRLIEKNFRCRFGEIDLIMQKKDQLIFIEVRSRHQATFLEVIESIHRQKQLRMIKTAQYYLQTHPSFQKMFCRFDVIAVVQTDSKIQYHWIKDAFQSPF